jgi:hypothetical protein
VYVRYEEDDNHNVSEWIRAESVLFYVGNVYIFIDCETGIDYSTTSEEEKRGLIINVSPSDSDKYYLFDTKVTVTYITEGYEKPNVLSRELRKEYYLENIPNSHSIPINIHISIMGVKKKVQTSSFVTEDEVLGKIEDADAVITRDSAYTVYFEILNYDVYTNLKLLFSTSLPENTTLILIDKTMEVPTFWSYKTLALTAEISLNKFVRMGTESSFFNAPANSSDVLKYQIIIDFADSEGCSGANIMTTISADISDADKSNGAPDFPASSLVIQLKDIASSSVVVTDFNEDTMKKNFYVEYLQITDNAIASKWNNRCGALLLTPDRKSTV